MMEQNELPQLERDYSVYGYGRTSTGWQENSIKVQADQQLDMARRLYDGKVDYCFFDEDVSGSVPFDERPMSKQLLETLKSNDVILVTKLDRMFRDASDALVTLKRLREMNVRIHFGGQFSGIDVNSDFGRVIFTMLSAMAEFERNQIRERVQETRAMLKANGRYCGGKVQWGYTVVDSTAEGDRKTTKHEVPKDWYDDAIATLMYMAAEGKILSGHLCSPFRELRDDFSCSSLSNDQETSREEE